MSGKEKNKNMKKLLLLPLLGSLLLVSCNESSNNSDESSNNVSINGQAMVVYYSATNHTKRVAEEISSHLNVPIHELKPVSPYSSSDLNYSDSQSRVSKEHQKIQQGEKINVELETTIFEEFATADYIFLGAPVWWGQLSWVIESFVANNDFQGKTIIPFGTSASSSYNLNNLTSLTKTAIWLGDKRFSSNPASSEITNWVDGLSID